ncbi:nuclear transport factor 2 family protein [Streptomyces sp. F63]|uniref:nuclear transport factor 2 family protein n=1 Tax=Streptomyces sp. F63 TaxID=2824887 RepID=UPI001B38A466|nr:nuclear transport factor 2 family protein [Streptomyces sp. F63]MBQ0984136.1 nuclear transport factor 2 family protein [Streptomyces sp. F63]
MTEQQTVPEAGAAFTPGDEERRALDAWFARYEALSARGEVEAMADMAVFPLNVVTDDAAGEGSAEQWDREQFTATMRRILGDAGGEEVSFESVRTPHFLTPSLVVVHSESEMTAGRHTRNLRYADILVKRRGEWAFQTMIQGGWGATGADGGAS